MLRELFGIGKRTVSVGELEVGDKVRLDTYKKSGQDYHLDTTITAIVPSQQLDGFYWIYSDKAPTDLLPIDRQVQLLKRAKR